MTIAKYNLKLNLEKCVFGVEAGKFLGFLLTERGIEANPNKCVAIIGNEKPHQCEGDLTVNWTHDRLSHFLSASGDKGYPYFQCLKKNSRFVLTSECEEAFTKLQEYLASPPVLGKPIPGTPIRLYFVITYQAISSIILQDEDEIQKSVYFVSKVLQGPKTRYQTIEKAALIVVFTARRLCHYFKSFTVCCLIYPFARFFRSPT